MRESALERRLVREVEKIGGECLKWTSPGNRGVPDRIVIVPSGRVYFVEMKAPGKPLEPLQERWAKRLKALGQKWYKIDSEIGIKRFIEEVMAA
ncbi:VRR-NUC domain-containing protein [Tumebacillus flagellatus]|uniref:Nuclease n=1 Tax=Tumebacillus flagellatus TaxID=1157490 RepID=A0A074LRK6_9BACL|nr:VRR-NUC domain-containing protein [Tumebacillus flagellatus]KEO84771.1 nuclease [Tumebacillus flagellatus]